MRRLYGVLLALALVLVNSCGGGSSSVSDSAKTTATTTPSVAAVTKSTGAFGGLMVNDQGEALMPLVSRDVSGTATGITGALWTDASGASVMVYLDDNGLPEKTVMGDFIILFSSWDTTAQTVDVAVIYAPTGLIQVFKGVTVDPQTLGTDIAAPLKLMDASKATCFPACDSDTANLAALIKLAALGVSVGGCGVGVAVSWGALALPCAGVIVSTAALVVDDEVWLNSLEKTSSVLTAIDAFKCTLGDAEGCVGAALEIGGSMVAATDTTLSDNSTHVTDANIFLQDPSAGSLSGDVVSGASPTGCVLSSSYECTEGSFLPCFTGGTKTCGSDCKWGACPATGSGDVATFDGTYTGGYSGSCTAFLTSGSVSGDATLVVSNGAITVSSDGGSGTGTVNSQGGSSFGAGGGGGISYSFTGTFSVSGSSGSASGTWTSSGSSTSCSGSWSVAR